MRESLSYRHNCDVVIMWTRRGICPLVSHSEQGCFPQGQTPEKLSGLTYTVPFKLIGRHFSGFRNIRAQMLRVSYQGAAPAPPNTRSGGRRKWLLFKHSSRSSSETDVPLRMSLCAISPQKETASFCLRYFQRQKKKFICRVGKVFL